MVLDDSIIPSENVIEQAIVPRTIMPIEQAEIDLIAQVSPRSQRIYRNDASAFAAWIACQGIQLSEFTRSQFLAYREYLLKEHQRATAARMLSVARRLLDEAVLHRILPANPGKEVKGISVSNESSHKALEKEGAKEMLAAIPRNTSIGKRDYALLSLLLRTGIRRTECAALTIGDLQMQSGHHIAVIKHGKGDKRRTVKLPVDVFRAIEVYIKATGRENVAPDAPLFCGFLKGGKSTQKGLTDKRIEQIVTQYGEATFGKEFHLTPHDLRASFITLAIEGGATLLQAQTAAGHSDPRTTERYHIRKTNLDDNAVDYIKL